MEWKRKIVQMNTSVETDTEGVHLVGKIVVLCDDGTIWGRMKVPEGLDVCKKEGSLHIWYPVDIDDVITGCPNTGGRYKERIKD